MVDALRDGCRVLRPGGTLIDLRPLPGTFSIDAACGSRVRAIGHGDATATLPDDRAADAAAAYACERRWLVARAQIEFEIRYYFDTAAEMADYVHTGRRPKRVTPSFEAIEAALSNARAEFGPPTRLRSARVLRLSSYVKGPAAP